MFVQCWASVADISLTLNQHMGLPYGPTIPLEMIHIITISAYIHYYYLVLHI